MGKTLFVTDLDGTLLGLDSQVSPRSASLITDLTRRGALITVATARTPATVEPLLEHTLINVPAIVMTGAAMWDRDTQRYVEASLMPTPLARETAGEFLAHGVNPFVYTLTDRERLSVYHTRVLTPRENTFYRDRLNLALKQFLFIPDYSNLEFTDTILLLGIGATAEIERLAETLRANPRLSVSAYADNYNRALSYIEVFTAGVSKAHAIERLKAMTGADRVVVYGDNLNDLSMFAVADEAVAVANAQPEVLAAATRTIGPNSADAVPLDIARNL